MKFGIIALVFCAMAFAACASPTQPTTALTPTTQIVQVVATPLPTSTTPPATATPTVTPSPTAFATAPAAGDAGIVPILMYHHLADQPSNASELNLTWTVAPKNFDAQMNWLADRGFHTISMGQLLAYLKQRQPLPSKPIVISFDDGWEEQYVSAFPSLRKNNFIGTFFVYTTPIDHSQFLTWAQLQEMSAAGMDIQAHTLTHPHLRTLAPDAAFKEIADSKSILEKRLGKPVTFFDYPFGEYNAAIIDMLKRAGFEGAVTLAAGYKQRADELFTLHRIRVSYNDTLDDFAKRLPQ
jgi:peptidoglycan/xylan/chitin deacetylase (PgdA/CDA1 family)